tara:strand:+ start:136 stop:609 length:474 start_codon:yes stop_codon:yes gene_type:complete
MNYLPYLYGAYGSNLNVAQMQLRCPNAKRVGTIKLNDWRLVFRRVADIEPCEGESVELGLWQITEECLGALDMYEGFPHLYYRRNIASAAVDGLEQPVMSYLMVDSQTVTAPADGYLGVIAAGYRDFGLDVMKLKDAIRHAFTNTSLSSTREKVVIT